MVTESELDDFARELAGRLERIAALVPEVPTKAPWLERDEPTPEPDAGPPVDQLVAEMERHWLERWLG